MIFVHRFLGNTEVLIGDGIQWQKDIQPAAYNAALIDPANTINEFDESQEALDEALSVVLAAIKTKEGEEADKDITFETKIYQSDEKSRGAARGAALEALVVGGTFTVDWIKSDDGIENLTDVKMKDLANAMTDQEKANKLNSRTLKLAVKALANDGGETLANRVVSVSGFDYSTGWV